MIWVIRKIVKQERLKNSIDTQDHSSYISIVKKQCLINNNKETVGFIGIGKMGLPMASRIAAGNYPLHVYDISEAALKAICDRTTARAQKTLKDLGRNVSFR
jgi:phosphoglycerate dehydrogenase-like enzyme